MKRCMSRRRVRVDTPVEELHFMDHSYAERRFYYDYCSRVPSKVREWRDKFMDGIFFARHIELADGKSRELVHGFVRYEEGDKFIIMRTNAMTLKQLRIANYQRPGKYIYFWCYLADNVIIFDYYQLFQCFHYMISAMEDGALLYPGVYPSNRMFTNLNLRNISVT